MAGKVGCGLLLAVLFAVAAVSRAPFAVFLLAWAVFRLNARYGEHGLMKLLAEKRHPRYLIHRKRVFRLFAKRKKRQQRREKSPLPGQ